MILTFQDDDTRELFLKGTNRRWKHIESVAKRKLDMIEAAKVLSDLRSPPRNHLEALKGSRKGQHSIRINDQCRVCFIWKDGGHNVENGLSLTNKRGKTMKTTRPISGWKLRRQPTTPGEMLLKEYLEPLNLSQHALAVKIGVPGTRIADIVHGRRAISADTALRLGRFFGTSPEFWLNLQQACDLYVTRSKLAETIEKQVPVYSEMMA